jgi:hypothetical protein
VLAIRFRGKIRSKTGDTSATVIGFGQKNEPIFSRSHNAVIRVYDEAGNVIETHESARYFRNF